VFRGGVFRGRWCTDLATPPRSVATIDSIGENANFHDNEDFMTIVYQLT
jgi:hypothetical protein